MDHSAYTRIVENSDTAVLMIHGIVGSPRHFDRILPAIPDSCSVFSLLLDGHGGTVQDFSRTSMKKWKQQVDTTLQEICTQYDKVIIIAHSMGTLLSIEASPNYPQVKAMQLQDVPLKVHVTPAIAIRALKLAFGRINDNNIWERTTKEAASVKPDARLWLYLGWLPRFWELLALCRQTRKQISSIQVPCHVFHSGRDELVSIKSAKYFRNLPLIRHEILQQSGHLYFPQEELAILQESAAQLISSYAGQKKGN